MHFFPTCTFSHFVRYIPSLHSVYFCILLLCNDLQTIQGGVRLQSISGTSAVPHPTLHCSTFIRATFTCGFVVIYQVSAICICITAIPKAHLPYNDCLIIRQRLLSTSYLFSSYLHFLAVHFVLTRISLWGTPCPANPMSCLTCAVLAVEFWICV
jgi:hypothetical protein